MSFSFSQALAACVVFAFTLLQLLSSILLLLRRRSRPRGLACVGEPVTIIMPIAGLSAFEAKIAARVLDLTPAASEILFCAFDASDPAAALIREEIARRPACAARLLYGRERHSVNPKMDNIEKGFAAARHDMVICVDGNVALPPDSLLELWTCWTPGTGLVSSPPLGDEPENFWADVECAILNTNFARWQLAAEAVGQGFAHGKLLMVRKSLLNELGGVRALTRDIAEDAAATKLVRDAGLRVRLLREPLAQPLGRRTASAVWSRNLRWARVRRRAFPALYSCEWAITPAVAVLAAAHLGSALGWPLMWAPLGLAAGLYSLEAWLSSVARWRLSPAMPLAFIVRDVMMLAVWIAGWFGSSYVWRQNYVALDESGPA